MKRIVSIIFGISSLTTLASAQDYNLKQCIDIAIANNPDYQTKLIREERAKLQVERSQSAFLPSLQASVGQSWDFGRSVDKTGVMSDRSSMGSSASIGANITLFSGFSRLHELKANKLQLEATMSDLTQARRDLGMQVTQRYYTLLYAERVRRLAESKYHTAQKQHAYTEGMYEAGKWAKDKLAESQAIVAQERQNLIQAENAVDEAKLNLQQLMQTNLTGVLPIEEREAIEEAHKLELSAQAMSQEISALSPALASNRYNQAAAKEMIKVSRAGYMPQVDLSIGYSNNYYKVLGDNYAMFNQPFAEQIRQNGRSYIGLRLSIPIFDAFRTRGQIRQAKLYLRELQATAINIEQNLRKEFELALLAVRLAQRKIDATQASIDANLSAEALALERWRSGRTTSNDLAQTQQRTFASQIEHLNAKYDYLMKAKLLEFYLTKQTASVRQSQ